MNKNEICQNALSALNETTKMERVFFDRQNKQRVVESFDVTDVAKQSAVDAITKLQNSDAESVLIYHGHDNVADYLYYLGIRESNLVLMMVVDYGMQRHNSYFSLEEILYRLDELERIKPNLTAVEIPNKVK